VKFRPAWLQHGLKRLANQNASTCTSITYTSSTSRACTSSTCSSSTHTDSTYTSSTCTSSTHKSSTCCLLNHAYNLLQVLSNMIDYGMEPQAALNAPRFSIEGVDSAYGPACVEHSQYVSPDCSMSCAEPACCLCTDKSLHWLDSLRHSCCLLFMR